jgi:hypothetical protein
MEDGRIDWQTHPPTGILPATQPIHHTCAMPAVTSGIPCCPHANQPGTSLPSKNRRRQATHTNDRTTSRPTTRQLLRVVPTPTLHRGNPLGRGTPEHRGLDERRRKKDCEPVGEDEEEVFQGGVDYVAWEASSAGQDDARSVSFGPREVRDKDEAGLTVRRSDDLFQQVASWSQ